MIRNKKAEMGAVTSKDLINWEDISDKVTFSEGLRHGTIIEVDKKILDKLIFRGSAAQEFRFDYEVQSTAIF